MVNWYKHDIPAWMDGTAGLTSNAYRAYHIICQMIYLNEEPIALNERYLAGACNQSLRAFRVAFSELLETGKLALSSGKISNSRAALELFRVEKNREHARKGGEKSSEVRQIIKKLNENNVNVQAPLKNNLSLLEKTRLDETREDIPPHGGARKRSKSRTALSPDSQITTSQKNHAAERGLHTSRVDGVFQKFRNYHVAKGNLMADWDAAWRTWVGNEIERAPPPTNQKSMVYGDDFG